MKKQYWMGMLVPALMTVLMLCGCMATVSGVSPDGAELGFPAESNLPVSSEAMDTEPADTTPTGTEPVGTASVDTAQGSTTSVDTAQSGMDDFWPDYDVGDGPLEAEETQYGRALEGEELQALWDRLDGKWILSDLQAWKQAEGLAYPVYDFSASAYRTCRLRQYCAFGSGIYEWIFTAAREQDGIYTFRAIVESSAPDQYDCRQNSGTLFTLQFTENGISLALSRPTQFRWQEARSTEDMNAPTAVRLATEEECTLLAQYGDEYGRLRVPDGGFQIFAGYEQPAQEYRFVTDEELERLVQETGL